MARNRLGQITSEHMISVKISKTLQNIADDVAIRVKPLVRDELEATLRSEIYASRTPATEKGQEVKEYNEKNKHQKPKPYHHTGLLASSVYATIDGDYAVAHIKDQRYDNGASTTEVYDYLKFGTTKTPKSDVYSYNHGTEFSQYISQEPHNFEARTREHMNQFLKDLVDELQNNPQNYIRKYLKKR